MKGGKLLLLFMISVAFSSATFGITLADEHERSGATTTSDEDIKVDIHHIVVEIGSGMLSVQEMIVFLNTGDKTYIGAEDPFSGKRETLRFFLPRDAIEPAVVQGLEVSRVVPTSDGFADTTPFEPGKKQVVYGYKLKFNSLAYTFFRKLDYPTNSFQFLIPNLGIKLASDRLDFAEPIDLGEKSYLHLLGSDLACESQIAIQISGLPTPFNQDILKWIAVGIVGFVLSAGLIYYSALGRGKIESVNIEESEIDLDEELIERREELLHQIADLDDRFENGEISEDDYREIREKRKAELVELTYKLGDWRF